MLFRLLSERISDLVRMNRGRKSAHSATIDVAVAILVDEEGRIYLGERPPSGSLAGYWEFPGGKCEAGETREKGLARELHEELGITIESAELLHRSINEYPSGDSFSLSYYVVRAWSGEIDRRHYQNSSWVSTENLMELRHLEGNLDFCMRLARGEFDEQLTRS